MRSLLTTTENTRELGGYRTIDERMTKRNSLLRSDVCLHPSKEDIEFLLTNKITTVIDLRCVDEVEDSPDGFSSVDGFSYYNCPIVEGSDAPDSVEEVPESYLRIACSDRMSEVFKRIAQAKQGVMFHCSAGKDRSGVVSAILLKHAGVCEEDIIENYMMTKECLKRRFERIHKEYPELDMNIVTPCERYMKDFLRLFDEKFQDTSGYFMKFGLTLKEINKIKELL